MELLKVISYLLGGGLVLSFGANQFVNSASKIARNFNISPVIIGLTIVAFGTSAPEMAVNIVAAYKGNTDIAVGNVVGSNIFNIAFILGICSIITPLFVSVQLIKIDIPFMCLVSLIFWFMGQDLQISVGEGIGLFVGIIFYTLLQIKLYIQNKKQDQDFDKEYSKKDSSLKNIFILTFGLVLLVYGAKFFVDGAVLGARWLGWSEAVIGLTIIAAGTSLPEVATSIAATLKGERDIAIGNVVGSNIFNILAVIGMSSLVSLKPIPLSPHMANIDLSLMLGISVLCLPFVLWKKQLVRWQGILFILTWMIYTIYLVKNS